MNQLDMQGRHAVVTGGASGLGLAIVQRLLHSGARVTIWDYDQAGMDKAVSDLRHQWPQAAIEAVQATIAGLVRSDARIDLLLAAIRLVIAGGRYYPADTLTSLMRKAPLIRTPA